MENEAKYSVLAIGIFILIAVIIYRKRKSFWINKQKTNSSGTYFIDGSSDDNIYHQHNHDTYDYDHDHSTDTGDDGGGGDSGGGDGGE